MPLVTNPRVGVGVIVTNDQGQVLLGLRRGSHAAGTWGMPGGAVEYREDILVTAARELLEETGMTAKRFVIETYCSVPYVSQKHDHWVTVYVRAIGVTGTPEILEPNKCNEWRWFDWNGLPMNLFQPNRDLLDSGWVPDLKQ